jgi:exopolyphosphatase / guanosine-5'-triphosphate,3'-diphosphate pyrophosphatase
LTRIEEEADSRGEDWERVRILLGRPPLGAFTVVLRRPDGTPAVIENAPFLDDGRPMPTRYWLVDPAARAAVGRLEADGGVQRAMEEVAPEAIESAHARYAESRDAAIPPAHAGPRPTGGVGGTRQGVKCLHAHVAWYLADGEDPVGHWAASQIGLTRDAFSHSHPSGSVAAVDCGTNSTRLIIVDASGEVLERLMCITRLGEGVDATHQLSQGAIDRTFEVLRTFRGHMDRHAVVRTRVAATSAARDAANADEFLTGVRDILGVAPEILSGEEEGRLAFAGATAHLPSRFADDRPVLVADIGGGSTELVVGSPGYANPHHVPTARSLDIGCVRVSERFLLHDPPQPAEVRDARAAVRAALRTAAEEQPRLRSSSLLVGLAGTVSTLASLKIGLAEYDRTRIHHSILATGDVEAWLAVLAADDRQARLSRLGMVRGREDVIVGGAIVLAEIMSTFGCSTCLVSEDDILDGLADTLLAPSEEESPARK